MSSSPPPTLLYAHGFASGPASTKGTALARHLADLAGGASACRLLDLRVPDRDRLRLSSMIDVVRGAVPQVPANARVLGIGSSLGGLTMARAAERDDRIAGLVLLAPAFRLVERWRERMGADAWEAWEYRGTHAFDAFDGGPKLRLDFGFIEDAIEVDGELASALGSADGLGPRWPDVRVPTVILQGVRDETVDPNLARTFAKSRPHVRVVELDDDHLLTKPSSLERLYAEVEAMRARLAS
jgi:pimeloyl-ACP methyl ester carboxylesterase